MSIKVSVVMTAYSHPEFIPEAVESILSQDIRELELIVVDDGSVHDIPKLLEPYRDKIRYIRQENTGLGPARDTGVNAAEGEYIAFCDSDDIHLPYRLSGHAALLDAFPDAAQVFSDLSMYAQGSVLRESTLRERALGLDERDFDIAIAEAFPLAVSGASLGLPVPETLLDCPVYHGHISRLIASRHVAWGGASMFRREMLRSVGAHDPTLRHWEDWSIVSRLSKRYSMVFWDVPVLLYRQHEGQQTKQAGKIGAEAYRDIVFNVWKSDASFARENPELLSDLVAYATLRNARYAMEAGEFSRGRRDIAEYIRNTPKSHRGYTALARNVVRDVLSRVRARI